MMEDIINPLIKPWLEQVQATEKHRLVNLSMGKFGKLLRATWAYQGTKEQAAIWTTEHIRKTALMRPKYLNMDPKRVAEIIFNPVHNTLTDQAARLKKYQASYEKRADRRQKEQDKKQDKKDATKRAASRDGRDQRKRSRKEKDDDDNSQRKSRDTSKDMSRVQKEGKGKGHGKGQSNQGRDQDSHRRSGSDQQRRSRSTDRQDSRRQGGEQQKSTKGGKNVGRWATSGTPQGILTNDLASGRRGSNSQLLSHHSMTHGTKQAIARHTLIEHPSSKSIPLGPEITGSMATMPALLSPEPRPRKRVEREMTDVITPLKTSISTTTRAPRWRNNDLKQLHLPFPGIAQAAVILHPREEPGRGRKTLLWRPRRKITSEPQPQPQRQFHHLHASAAPPLPLNETDSAEA